MKNVDNFRVMDQLGSLKRKRSGGKRCNCGKWFSNTKTPKFCDVCGYLLGGSYEPPLDIFTDAVVIRDVKISSVRLRKTGENLRIFVDLNQNKVREGLKKFCGNIHE